MLLLQIDKWILLMNILNYEFLIDLCICFSREIHTSHQFLLCCNSLLFTSPMLPLQFGLACPHQYLLLWPIPAIIRGYSTVLWSKAILQFLHHRQPWFLLVHSQDNTPPPLQTIVLIAWSWGLSDTTVKLHFSTQVSWGLHVTPFGS